MNTLAMFTYNGPFWCNPMPLDYKNYTNGLESDRDHTSSSEVVMWPALNAQCPISFDSSEQYQHRALFL